MVHAEIPSGHYRKADGTLAKLKFKSDAVAVDATDVAEVSAVIKRIASKRNAKAIADKSADAKIAKLFPTVLAVAEDDAEAEAEALGLNGEDSDALNTRYQQDLNGQREYWNSVNKRNRQRSQFAGSTGRYPSPSTVASKGAKAVDSIKSNAKKARQYSAFASAASIIARQATA